MLRAWRGLDRFQPRAPIGAWLHRIATNVSLRMLEQRGRGTAAVVDAHVEPYPDRLLDDMPSPDHSPEATVEEREGIALAFITAMQLLTPKQRVAVVLRDALGWSAREVADVLQDSVPAVNSALQRGRQRLEQERREGTLARDPRARGRPHRRTGDAPLSGGVGGSRHRCDRRAARGGCATDDAARGCTLRGRNTNRSVLRDSTDGRGPRSHPASVPPAQTASPHWPPTRKTAKTVHTAPTA